MKVESVFQVNTLLDELLDVRLEGGIILRGVTLCDVELPPTLPVYPSQDGKSWRAMATCTITFDYPPERT